MIVEEFPAGSLEGAPDENHVPQRTEDGARCEQEAPRPVLEEAQSVESIRQHRQSQHQHHRAGGQDHGADVAENALAA